MGVGDEEHASNLLIMDAIEEMGLPMVDGMSGMPLEHGNDHINVAKKLLGELPIRNHTFCFASFDRYA